MDVAVHSTERREIPCGVGAREAGDRLLRPLPLNDSALSKLQECALAGVVLLCGLKGQLVQERVMHHWCLPWVQL